MDITDIARISQKNRLAEKEKQAGDVEQEEIGNFPNTYVMRLEDRTEIFHNG